MNNYSGWKVCKAVNNTLTICDDYDHLCEFSRGVGNVLVMMNLGVEDIDYGDLPLSVIKLVHLYVKAKK